MLRSVIFALPILALAMSFSSLPASAQGPVQDALKGCENELKSYCSAVTPGNARLLSCARAHEDKLSQQCIYAINRASYWVDFLANTIRYVSAQCEADAVKYCPDVKLGEERVLNCLADNRDKLNNFCSAALADIGR